MSGFFNTSGALKKTWGGVFIALTTFLGGNEKERLETAKYQLYQLNKIEEHVAEMQTLLLNKWKTKEPKEWFEKMSAKERADGEPVDPKKAIEEACKPECVKYWIDYKNCVQRIKGDESGHKHCTGQYFDLWGCIDQCVAPKLFAKLK